MSSLNDGHYLIVPAGPAAPPPAPVGANHESGPVGPVVVGGKDNVWTVHKVKDNIYTLILEKTGTSWLSKDVGGEVMVEIMPVPGQWQITGNPENNTYTIEVPTGIWPGRAWTIESTQPGTKVRIGMLEIPMPGQLWNFDPTPKV